MLTLISRLVSHLPVGRKLLLIYLLDFSAVRYVSSIMISEKYIAINFARKEVEGTAYVAPLRDTRLALPVPLGSDPAPTPPLTALLNAWREHLRGAEQAHGIDMASSDTASHLLAAYDAATATGLRDVERFDQLVEAGRSLITRIGNQSNLILDPDLDSYYTMSLVVLRFPELWELLGQNARKIIEISGSDGEQRARRPLAVGNSDRSLLEQTGSGRARAAFSTLE